MVSCAVILFCNSSGSRGVGIPSSILLITTKLGLFLIQIDLLPFTAFLVVKQPSKMSESVENLAK